MLMTPGSDTLFDLQHKIKKTPINQRKRSNHHPHPQLGMSFVPFPSATATLPQCYNLPPPPQGGRRTQHTTMCADHPTSPIFLHPSSPMSDFKDTSPAFSSGSSAQNSSYVTDEEDIGERDTEPLTVVFSPVEEVVEYRPLLQASPIYSFESTVGYGTERVLFIEKLLCESMFIRGKLSSKVLEIKRELCG